MLSLKAGNHGTFCFSLVKAPPHSPPRAPAVNAVNRSLWGLCPLAAVGVLLANLQGKGDQSWANHQPERWSCVEGAPDGGWARIRGGKAGGGGSERH